MRRRAAILIFFIYIFGATELDQLLKFPLLVRHYVIHKRQNAGITVAMFIKIHYLDPQLFDGDYNEDMQLPFKQADDHCLTLPTVLPTPLPAIYYDKTPLVCEYNLYKPPFKPLLNQKDVFRPPRA